MCPIAISLFFLEVIPCLRGAENVSPLSMRRRRIVKFVKFKDNGLPRYFVDRQREYEKLYTFVTGQPLIEKPTLGKILIIPPRLLPSFRGDDNTFSSVCKVIWPYMEDNRRIFQDFWPNSGADNSGSSAKAVRFDLSLWYGKRDTIVCNNNIIANHIRSNINLIPEAHLHIFEKWLSYIDAFALHVHDNTIDYREHQFPKDVISIVREQFS
jgi:hypothetical protein